MCRVHEVNCERPKRGTITADFHQTVQKLLHQFRRKVVQFCFGFEFEFMIITILFLYKILGGV